jgi:hypothetical protein
MNNLVLNNLKLQDLPMAWVTQFHLSPRQRFTVYLTVQDVSESLPSHSTLSIQQERIALMRAFEQQLRGTGQEDSQEWIKYLKASRTVSKPTLEC